MASARCPQPRSVASPLQNACDSADFRFPRFEAYVRRGEPTTSAALPRRSPWMIARKISPSSPMPILTAIPLRAIARRFGRISKTSSRHKIDPSFVDAQAVAASLGVDPNTGLSQAEAERRLAQYGRTSSHPHHPCQNGRSSWRSSKTPRLPAARCHRHLAHRMVHRKALRLVRKAARRCAREGDEA